jgi:hypothetical protein
MNVVNASVYVVRYEVVNCDKIYKEYIMSQSDYISYKRTRREMDEYSKTPNKLPAILEAGKYITFKDYALVNTIVSHKEQYDKFVNPNVPIVFDIVKSCAIDTPVLPFCVGTDQRLNRTPVDPELSLPVFRKPPLNDIPKSVRMKWKNVLSTNMCKNACDDSYGKW